jgi:hypothetical protein
MSPATCAAGDHSRHCGPLGTRQSFCCALSSAVSGRPLRLQGEPRQAALSCQPDAVGQRALRFEADDALDNIAAALDSLDQYGLARDALVVESRWVAEHLQPTANRPVPQHQTASLPHSHRTPAAQGRGECDIVAELANPLFANLILHMLRVDKAEYRHWVTCVHVFAGWTTRPVAH